MLQFTIWSWSNVVSKEVYYIALLTTPNRAGFTPLKQAVFGSSFKVVKDLIDLLEKELSEDEFYKALFHKNKNGDYFTTCSENNDYVAIRALLSAKREESKEKLRAKQRTNEESEAYSSGREKRGPQFFAPAKEKSTSSRTNEQKRIEAHSNLST